MPRELLRKVMLQRKGYTESIAWECQASEKGLYGDNCFGRSCFRERLIPRELLRKAMLQRKVIPRELLRKVRLQGKGYVESIA